MFDFTSRDKTEQSKCYVTYGRMGNLDRKQPPTRRKPYAAILALPFIHKAELIFPKELYELIKDDLAMKFKVPVYSRVILPLGALLEGEFFSEYIKKGSIIMLSEGTYGVDDVFCLRDGILTMTLGKESYERAGLSGKPDGAKGKRGTRPRWIVEINLRLPSMLHGKKGFDRILYAFKNVLSSPITWLFIDLQPQVLTPNPIEKHFPNHISCSPIILQDLQLKIPCLTPPNEQEDTYEDEFNEFSIDIYEWLSLISLESPRVHINDRIDPFLSRYSLPATEPTNLEATEIIKLTWEGFLPSLWAHNVLVQTILAAASNQWFSFATCGFNESLPTGNGDITILKLPGNSNEYVMWKVDHS